MAKLFSSYLIVAHDGDCEYSLITRSSDEQMLLKSMMSCGLVINGKAFDRDRPSDVELSQKLTNNNLTTVDLLQ